MLLLQTSGDGKDACVILLFSSWVLDTRTKFVFGCVGVILLGSYDLILPNISHSSY